MKRLRLLALVAGSVGVLLALVVAVVFSSAFQTWAVRRAIASRADLGLKVGSVSAGMKRVVLRDVRLERPEAVVSIPQVELDMPMMTAGWDKQVWISRLVAKGWTIDLSTPPRVAAAPRGAESTSTGARSPQPTVPAAQANPAATAAYVFAGIFRALELPIDVSLDNVQLEGEVILPATRGRAQVVLTGGGFGTGREGKFDVVADARLTDAAVNKVQVRGTLTGTMDSPRTFARLGTKLDLAAAGERLPQGAKLQVELGATRSNGGESYAVMLSSEGQPLVTARADLANNGQPYDGEWKLNVRDTDLAPFTLGVSLPSFTAVGEGKFAGDVHFESVRAVGRANVTAGRLEKVLPQLGSVGEVKVVADFDVVQHGDALTVRALEAAVNGKEPVATLRVAQAFEFNLQSRQLVTADATRDLASIAFHAVPVAWISPWLPGLSLAGGRLQGELSVGARNGGIGLRTISPLVADGLQVAAQGKPLVDRLDATLTTSADYTPRGWQAEIGNLTLKAGPQTVLALEAKAGQLTGNGQPLKATGRVSAHLPSLVAQPAAAGSVVLSGGEAGIDFVVSLGATKEIQADVTVKNLATLAETNPVKLPDIATHLRADVAADGKIVFNAPLQLERAERKSDLTLAGSVGPLVEKARAIDIAVSSTQLVIDDAQVLAAMIPDRPADAVGSAPPSPRDNLPPWHGVHGVVVLDLKNVIYSDAVQVSNVTGRLRMEAGVLKLETIQAGVGEGRANVSGAVTFNPAAPQPYALLADVAIREFDPGPLFRALADNAPATVEGKFDLTSKLSGNATTLAGLAAGAGGNFHLTSRSGVFRGLPVNVSTIVGDTSRLATWIASAGTALSAMTGKKEYADVASKAEAVAELARGLNPISYDQLSVVLSRDAALNTTLRNFTLIAPEVRLTGTGTALHKPGSTLLDDSLAMEFTLRARGRQGELLKYLGALEPQTDDLGYATCTLPLKIGGTLGKPDTSELNSKLTALALEKSGFGEKAAEFLSKIRGGK